MLTLFNLDVYESKIRTYFQDKSLIDSFIWNNDPFYINITISSFTLKNNLARCNVATNVLFKKDISSWDKLKQYLFRDMQYSLKLGE